MPAALNIDLKVTGDIGAGQQMIAQTITGIRTIRFRLKDGAVDVFADDPPRMLTIQFSNLTGVTFPSGTLVISMTDV